MDILSILGLLALGVLVGLAVLHATGNLHVSITLKKDDDE